MKYKNHHSFHIPVLGIGYSVDAPLKVAKYGISSVVSLVDDELVEQLREHYSKIYNIPFSPIARNVYDVRAKRITAYLNMLNNIVEEQMSVLKLQELNSGSELDNYFSFLPDESMAKSLYMKYLACSDEDEQAKIKRELLEYVTPGSIDVNIMTKLDKSNYDQQGSELPSEYNDAHSALRGFAQSDLDSTVVFSAGMNPRLYSYLENFSDFYPASNGYIKKKIAIKVSDFRSALIQGKFLAKKGLWVSEYRIESGLNCGGHAFATDGLLMGPILEEFKNRKEELASAIKEILFGSFENMSIDLQEDNLDVKITYQGGIGDSNEHNFMRKNYGVSSVGWGSPFLLVPEVINVDDSTLALLADSNEDDLYLSHVSPLGVRFNSIRNNEKDIEKMERAALGKPGSSCPKKFLVSNREFSDKPKCSASISYINKKIAELETKFDGIDLKNECDKIVEKACLCVGLSASTLKVKGITVPKQSEAVAVCPGPNLAYFSKVVSLKEMIDHIYGRNNLLQGKERPSVFMKELRLYIDYLSEKIEENIVSVSDKKQKLIDSFAENITNGIEYYKTSVSNLVNDSGDKREKFVTELEMLEEKLNSLFLVLA